MSEAREIMPLYSRPGLGERTEAESPCGCSFSIRPAMGDLVWNKCPSHEYAGELVQAGRRVRTFADAAPLFVRGKLVNDERYKQLLGILDEVDRWADGYRPTT